MKNHKRDEVSRRSKTERFVKEGYRIYINQNNIKDNVFLNLNPVWKNVNKMVKNNLKKEQELRSTITKTM